MLFLPDLSHQEVTHHQSTGVRRNRVLNGPREIRFTDNNHTMETGQPDVSDTISPILAQAILAQGKGSSQKVACPLVVNGVDLVSSRC